MNTGQGLEAQIVSWGSKCKANSYRMPDALGSPVSLVKSLKGTYKKKAKDDAKFFNQLTGWTGRDNEDKRDTGLLALYG